MKNITTSRKLWFAIFVMVVSTVAMFLSKSDFDQWSEFAKWIFGIYASANVGEHVTNVLKKNG